MAKYLKLHVKNLHIPQLKKRVKKIDSQCCRVNHWTVEVCSVISMCREQVRYQESLRDVGYRKHRNHKFRGNILMGVLGERFQPRPQIMCWPHDVSVPPQIQPRSPIRAHLHGQTGNELIFLPRDLREQDPKNGERGDRLAS